MKSLLDAKFKIKDLCNLKYFLGMEVTHSSQGITLYQRNYVLDLLQDSGLLTAKPNSTRMNYTIKLSKDFGPTFSDVQAYHRLIGHLLYLTQTCLDIAYVIG